MREERIGDAVLYCGDCPDVMAGMADEAVDHVITDPPFGETTHSGARTLRNLDINLATFDSMSTDDFEALCATAVRLAKRWVLMTCEWRLPDVPVQAQAELV